MILISDIPSSDQIEAGLLIRGVLEAPTRGVLSKKKVFLEISQNSQEKTCVGVSHTRVFL